MFLVKVCTAFLLILGHKVRYYMLTLEKWEIIGGNVCFATPTHDIIYNQYKICMPS